MTRPIGDQGDKPTEMRPSSDGGQTTGQTSENPEKDKTTPLKSSLGKAESPKTPTPKKEPDGSKPIQKRASIGPDSILEEPIKRRSFFSWLTIAWVAFAAATTTFFGMILRFMFPNVLFEGEQTFKAGYPDEYNVGEVVIRWKEKYGVWIIRTPEYFFALSTVCTHLGCTPNWLPNEDKFKCPCHGSGFRKSGINFEGPAPRPLERYKITLADDGQIFVDKTKKFAYEKGQWSNPESSLVI